MGVKGLWTILGPFCDRKPLYEIRGEKVAVDLSGWVCDSQNVTDNYAQPRLYLRNLYFRTSYLLLYGVTPVFVLEGTAPAMKGAAMAARAQLQALARGTRPPAKKAPTQNTSRKRFASVLSHCEKLLSSMGLRCVTGVGEAEAMCAHLNATGEVSAVISQDSDCFVYGATRLYRNFTVSGAGIGTVDIYDLLRIQKSIDLGRNKMVALALLCGSDYNGTGVDGVGYSSASSFIMQHSDKDIIARLVSWSAEPSKYEEYRRRVEDVTSCTACGHGGSSRRHLRQGCAGCGTHSSCTSNGYREWRQHMKTELQLRQRALAGTAAFPDAALLREFLDPRETTPEDFNPQWECPNLIKFTKLMKHWLCWTESYCVEKFLPLLTRWQLLHAPHPPPCPLHPLAIKKKRNPKGVPSYEVVWHDPEGHYAGLVSDDQVEGEDALRDLWTTVERQDHMEAAYPLLVEQFKKSLIKEKPKKAGKKKKDTDVCDLETSMKNLSMDRSKTKIIKKNKRKGAADVSFRTKPRKTRKKRDQNSKGQEKIDSYLTKPSTDKEFDFKIVNKDIERLKNAEYKSPVLLRKTHLFDDAKNSTAELLRNMSNCSTEDEISEADLSNIIQNIVTNANKVDINKIILTSDNNYSTPIKTTSSGNVSGVAKRRVSHFFGNVDNDFDAFEKSMDLKNVPDSDAMDMELNDTVTYDLTDFSPILKKTIDTNDKENILTRNENVLTLEERLFGKEENCLSANVKLDDSPKRDCNASRDSVVYTPLLERIRKAKQLK